MHPERPAGSPTLYGYWRSTAAYRVRIALNLKGIEWEHAAVHLVREGGEQHQPAYRALNPAGLVPALRWGGVLLTQSLAICEFLDEVAPTPPLLPTQPSDRAWVRALAQDIAVDVHPLNNLRVMQYLEREQGADGAARSAWMAHWMTIGFRVVESRLSSRLDANPGDGGPCCFGEAPGLADICLVAQAYNADRFDVSLRPYPRLNAVEEYCRTLEAFRAALPEAQPDADQPSGQSAGPQ